MINIVEFFILTWLMYIWVRLVGSIDFNLINHRVVVQVMPHNLVLFKSLLLKIKLLPWVCHLCLRLKVKHLLLIYLVKPVTALRNLKTHQMISLNNNRSKLKIIQVIYLRLKIQKNKLKFSSFSNNLSKRKKWKNQSKKRLRKKLKKRWNQIQITRSLHRLAVSKLQHLFHLALMHNHNNKLLSGRKSRRIFNP